MNNRLFLRLAIVGFILLTLTFTSCEKRKFLKFGNQITLINPFTTFNADNPKYIMDTSPQCEFIILDKNGDEIVLEYFSLTEESVVVNIDWDNYKDEIKLGSKHTFITRVGYYGEDSYTEYTDSNGYVSAILKSDFYDHYATQSYENAFDMKPNRIYSLDPEKDTFVDEGIYQEKESKSSGGGDALTGKWMAVSGCSNSNGERNWFNFSSGGSGQSFSADCNNLCAGLGVKFYFSYTSSGSSLNITWTSVGDYCGVSSSTPSPETLTYSISGDIMKINGTDYKKQ